MARLAFPKPRSRAAEKRQQKAEEVSVIQAVRAEVAYRDGRCRLRGVDVGGRRIFGSCEGPSEWAHWPRKRSQTRNESPSQRHTSVGSLMLCRFHHQRQERGEIQIAAEHVARGCNGPLSFSNERSTYFEPHWQGARTR